MVLRSIYQSNDALLESRVIYSIFNAIAGGSSLEICPEDKVDQYVLFLTPFLFT